MSLPGTPWEVELPRANPTQLPSLGLGLLNAGCVPVRMPPEHNTSRLFAAGRVSQQLVFSFPRPLCAVTHPGQNRQSCFTAEPGPLPKTKILGVIVSRKRSKLQVSRPIRSPTANRKLFGHRSQQVDFANAQHTTDYSDISTLITVTSSDISCVVVYSRRLDEVWATGPEGMSHLARFRVCRRA